MWITLCKPQAQLRVKEALFASELCRSSTHFGVEEEGSLPTPGSTPFHPGLSTFIPFGDGCIQHPMSF